MDRYPHNKLATTIWCLCESRQIEGVVSALTFANLVYVMRKQLDADGIAHVYASLSQIFKITALEAADLSRAAALRWRDFEDALQCVTAERVHAQYIITRNVNDFAKSTIKAVTPENFLIAIHGELERENSL